MNLKGKYQVWEKEKEGKERERERRGLAFLSFVERRGLAVRGS